jgi:hypothetical protein
MHAAKRSTDSCALLHERNASVEVVDAQQDVVEHGRNVLGRT